MCVLYNFLVLFCLCLLLLFFLASGVCCLIKDGIFGMLNAF